ncbi:hypothetical protein CYMTET_28489 [Cymbomonas tetramitiformis]|uniref:Uncharacterized protein n=1 Tax=Cymbomonas tetramitiformis TaxID=36881 RepID=A0AAE0KVU9_9CHLO|nr:hypothetical protein CYMTET_28489 [Cymbomonas tetramitiformis]
MISRFRHAFRELVPTTRSVLAKQDQLASVPIFPQIFPQISVRQFHHDPSKYIGTTVLCVRKDGEVIVVADGQCTQGSRVVKPNVVKVRRIGTSGEVITGFAGATADAFTLFDRLEAKLEEHPGQVRRQNKLGAFAFLTYSNLLTRSAVELAKAWRNDKYLRKLDALMVVADDTVSLTITGGGDVLEPHDGIIGIGSGGDIALAAARALIDIPGMTAGQIAHKAMTIAADTCVYTNHNFVVETIPTEKAAEFPVHSGSSV